MPGAPGAPGIVFIGATMAWPDTYHVSIVEYEKVEAPSGYRVTLARGDRRLQLPGPYTPSVEPPTDPTDFDVETICSDIKAADNQLTAKLQKFLQPAAYNALT